MAEKTISIKKNFIMNALLAMSSFIFPMITFPYVSRILGPAGYGKVGFATSLVSYFNMFAQLGVPTYGVRACAKVRDDREKLSRTVKELLTLNLVMSAAAYAGLFLALLTVPRLREDRLLYLIVSSTILFSAIGMEWLYKGLEQYTYITVRSLVFKFIALLAMFLLVHAESDYVMYGAISVFAASASGLMNLLHARRYVSLRGISGCRYTRHFKAVGIFFAMACAATVYTHLDTLMLGFMTTNQDVGYYDAAVRVKQILVSIVTSLGTVLLPRASYYIEHGQREAFQRISGKALHFIALTSIPAACYFILFAEEGIGFLSGSAYRNSVAPMQIIMPTLIFIGLTNIMGIQMLVPLGREKVVLYSEIAGAVTDLILNFLLIPGMRSAGAAIGTLSAEAVVLIWQYVSLRDEVRDAFKRIPWKKILTAVPAAGIASVWLKFVLRRDTSWQCFLVLALSAVLFFGVYAGLLTLEKEPVLLEMEQTVLGKLIPGKRLRSSGLDEDET